MNAQYSTTHISQELINEISEVLQGMEYGSVELYIVDKTVTQITKRQIKKTTSQPKKTT